jgi:hypothetical protein
MTTVAHSASARAVTLLANERQPGFDVGFATCEICSSLAVLKPSDDHMAMNGI